MTAENQKQHCCCFTGETKYVNEFLVAVDTVFDWTHQGLGFMEMISSYNTACIMKTIVDATEAYVLNELGKLWELECIETQGNRTICGNTRTLKNRSDRMMRAGTKRHAVEDDGPRSAKQRAGWQK